MASFDQRNSVPSTQTRCMTTASLRASATRAFLPPIRRASRAPQAFRADHRATRDRSTPAAIAERLLAAGGPFERIGLEAGPLSQWIYAGLVEVGLPAVCIETRHMHAVLSPGSTRPTVATPAASLR